MGSDAARADPASLIMKELGHAQYGARYRDATELPSYVNFDFGLVEDESEILPQPPGLFARAIGMPIPEVPRDDRFGAPWAEEFLGDVVGMLGMAADVPDIPLERAFGVTVGAVR